MKPGFASGLILGGLSDIPAIRIWKISLSGHPVPPSVSFRKHALNLFFAHIVFGLFSIIGYNMSD
jgi:hypothetical protein